MFFRDRRRDYQNLLQYLREYSKRRLPVNEPIPAWVAVAALGLACTAGVLAMINPLFILAPLLAAGALIAVMATRKRPMSMLEPRERLAVEARPVVQGMLALAEGNRLHKEIDSASLQLLEECAHHWRRVQVVFNSPFWTSSSLPMQYQAAREQAIRAAESTMDELMLIYRVRIPEKGKATGSNSVLEWVDDTLNEFVFQRPQEADFIPDSFEPTMKIAEKLQALADEAEKVSRELVVDPAGAASVLSPGAALDASLMELRQIRQAEDELRQNLGGQ